MVKSTRQSWLKTLVVMGVFFCTVWMIADSVRWLTCPACEGTGRCAPRIRTASSSCPYCGVRKESILEADLIASLMIQDGHGHLLIPDPQSSYFIMQWIRLAALPMAGIFVLIGVAFIFTRVRFLDCTRCRFVGSRGGLHCDRCCSQGSTSLLRLWTSNRRALS
jgi:hypothetical protein